ncbi:MAG: aldehyde ferredoxin oxidoreductase [Firmicutes bacterium]|nr:aldehyde ferredoxin oxidoreductase [Bacillota bacterium]
MHFLDVNMKTGVCKFEPVPPELEPWGGRGLTARLLLSQINPTCYPLGPSNILIMATGVLAGSNLSGTDQISVGGKSPLTGGIKESNSGGTASRRMAALGIKAVIVRDLAPPDRTYILEVGGGTAALVERPDLKGLKTHLTAARLLKEYGSRASVACVGPAGEMGMAAAGVSFTDREGNPNRVAARGGLGAVMGRKGLKAVVFKESERRKTTPPSPRLREILAKIVAELEAHPATGTLFRRFGTAYMVQACNKLGGMPVNNFSRGELATADKISGERLEQVITERGGEGEVGHICQPGCIVRCSNIFPDQDGEAVTGPVEYETIALMGTNLGLDDFDRIAVLNRACNELGLDTIETGGAIGVLMESGRLAFGDYEGILRVLEEIEQGTILGRVVGNGAGITGKVLGVERVPVVKNQTISAYDPRAIKGTGVTFCTTPMGGDHTAGLTIAAKIDHHKPEGQAAVSRHVQRIRACFDNLGFCSFHLAAFLKENNMDLLAEFYSEFTGRPCDAKGLFDLGKEVINTEREFNRRAGFNEAHDRLPEFFTREPLPPHNLVFDVPDSELDSLHDAD